MDRSFSVTRALVCIGLFGLLNVAGQSWASADVDLTGDSPPTGAVWLDSLDISGMQQDFGSPQARKSVTGEGIAIGGVTFVHGVGTHANSDYILDLHGDATRFQSEVGVDSDAGTNGSVTFEVIVDGNVKATTPVMHGGDKPLPIDIDLTGAKRLELKVTDGGDGIDYDHADWAGAAILLAAGAANPTPFVAPREPGRLVIPELSSSPEIHYPKITGATPGRPFLFMIPATGATPLTFLAKGLPKGLQLDSATGIISGSLRSAGTTVVSITVKNSLGKSQSQLTIVGGDHLLALTPPMGWNSWNVWAGNVDEPKVKAAADVMISSTLAAHGFEYVNIDDTWEAGRDAQGNIQSNKKFPDMKGLADYVHSKGLKIGIYSSPGPTTCGGYTASYQHEDQDAASYAYWGFDYLKYDWCSYSGIDPNPDLAGFQKPYAVMRSSLDKVNRDIVFSFCQYGMGDVWKWGQQIGGNCWRTTGDINDSWNSLHGIYESQNGHEKYAGPGHWNDPDMLVVGIVGWGNTHPSRLTQNEQILHISMWCLLSAPLLIGCDMTRLDPFTLALLTNDEAIAINQDQLGKPAGKISTADNGGEVWARPLSGGSKAVGLINPTSAPLDVTVTWASLGLNGSQKVRDLWLHKNLGPYETGYTVTVPTHGAVLLNVSPK
jgi:alpha-galactosidase